MNSLRFLSLCLLGSMAAQAAPLKQATVTRVVNDVKLLPEQQPPVPAEIGNIVAGKTAVTTGVQSRAELKFADHSLTRLGANSVFTIEQGTRNVELKQGVLLMQVPKKMGGARVRTAAITAAVTGTTLMLEYQPNNVIKVIVLEGTVDVYHTNKPAVFRTLHSGDILFADPKIFDLPDPLQVDLKQLKKTSLLTNEKVFGPLGNVVQLQDADAEQQDLKQKGELNEVSLLPPGRINGRIANSDQIRDFPPKIIKPKPLPEVVKQEPPPKRPPPPTRQTSPNVVRGPK